MKQRIAAIRERIQAGGATAALVSARPDIRWACGFSGSNGVLLITQDGAHFVTDGRYTAQARAEVQGASVHVPGYQLLGYIAEQGWLSATNIALFQSEHLSFKQATHLFSLFDHIDWKGAERLVESLAAIKTSEEIDAIRRAQAISEQVLAVLLADVIRSGITEQDLAAEIIYRHLRAGAEGMAFDPIVASGPNSALPHATPTSRMLQAGDMLTLDFGCVVDGYCSDMTRTVAIGAVASEAETVYDLVNEARKTAIGAARAGMTSKALDHVARDVIGGGGYGPEFSHSLGHGVGLRIHEWPMVSYRTEEVLPAGAVVTIEPGIYLPGRFGVRIEDMIWLQEDGNERLTSAPDELIIC